MTMESHDYLITFDLNNKTHHSEPWISEFNQSKFRKSNDDLKFFKFSMIIDHNDHEMESNLDNEGPEYVLIRMTDLYDFDHFGCKIVEGAHPKNLTWTSFIEMIKDCLKLTESDHCRLKFNLDDGHPSMLFFEDQTNSEWKIELDKMTDQDIEIWNQKQRDYFKRRVSRLGHLKNELIKIKQSQEQNQKCAERVCCLSIFGFLVIIGMLIIFSFIP